MRLSDAAAQDLASSTLGERLSFMFKWLGFTLGIVLAVWEVASVAMAISDAGGNGRLFWQSLLPEAEAAFWPLAFFYVAYACVGLINAIFALDGGGQDFEPSSSSDCLRINPGSGYPMVGDSGLDRGGYMYGSGPSDRE